LNHIKFSINFNEKLRKAIKLFIIDESFILKDVLIINIEDHQIIKIRDSDFDTLVNINFFDKNNNISASIKCKVYI